MGTPRCQKRSQIFNDRNRSGLELAFGVALAEVDCRSDCTSGSVNIDDFQGTSFGNPAGGVEANSEEGAIASGLQTFVEQQFDFLLREDFCLSVPFYLHAWCILDPMLQSLAYLLHCCTGLGGFLNVVAEGERHKLAQVQLTQ